MAARDEESGTRERPTRSAHPSRTHRRPLSSTGGGSSGAVPGVAGSLDVGVSMAEELLVA